MSALFFVTYSYLPFDVILRAFKIHLKILCYVFNKYIKTSVYLAITPIQIKTFLDDAIVEKVNEMRF